MLKPCSESAAVVNCQEPNTGDTAVGEKPFEEGKAASSNAEPSP